MLQYKTFKRNKASKSLYGNSFTKKVLIKSFSGKRVFITNFAKIVKSFLSSGISKSKRKASI